MIRRAWQYAWWLALVTATGYGQVLFSASPLAGALIVLGLAALSPRAAMMGVLACALATVVARRRRYPMADWADWRRGLYGYAGALIGISWGWLFGGGLLSWLLLVAAAVMSPFATRMAHRLLTPRGLPALAAPALVLVWAAVPLLPLVPAPSPSRAVELLGWMITLAGLAAYSRLSALAAVMGAGVGVGVSLAMTGAVHGVIVSNAMPTAIALASVFLPWSAASLAVGAVAAGAAGALAWLGVLALGPWSVPVLVAPFNVVTVLVIMALRVPAVRRHLPGRPAPLPLASVGRPEAGRAVWSQQRRLAKLVANARRVCVLTGAGVSTAAGLPDFRGPQGLWARQGRITLDMFVASTDVRERYWKEEEAFYRLVGCARPAAVHRALLSLHREGRLTAVVTQNVDGLHQAAGLPEESVIEIHGAINHAVCVDCGWRLPRAALSEAIAEGAATFYCERCRGLMKGGSVMFGERVSVGVLQASLCALLGSDLLLVLGTSLVVAPASDLVRWARDAGIPVAIVNATPTRYDEDAEVTVTIDVGVALLRLLDDE